MAAAQGDVPTDAYRRALTQQRRAQILVEDKLIEPKVFCGELEEQVQLLQRFYDRHDPSKVGRVTQLLAWFYGREAELFEAISNKYGEEIRPLVVNEVPPDERTRRIKDIDVAGDTSSNASSPGTARTGTPTVGTASTVSMASSPRTGHVRRFFDGGHPGSPARPTSRPRQKPGARGWFRGLAWQGVAYPDRKRSPRFPAHQQVYSAHYGGGPFQTSVSPASLPSPYAGEQMRYAQPDPRWQHPQYHQGDPHSSGYPVHQAQYPAPMAPSSMQGPHGYTGGQPAQAHSFHATQQTYYADRQRTGLRRTASDPQGLVYHPQPRSPYDQPHGARRASTNTRWDTRLFPHEKSGSSAVPPGLEAGHPGTRQASRSLDESSRGSPREGLADIPVSLPFPSDVPDPRRVGSLPQMPGTRASAEGLTGGKEDMESLTQGFWSLAMGGRMPAGLEKERSMLSSLAEDTPRSTLGLGPDLGRELRAGLERAPSESGIHMSSPLDSSGSTYFPDGSSLKRAHTSPWGYRGSRTSSDPPPMLATFEETTDLHTVDTDGDFDLLDSFSPMEGVHNRERRTYSDPPRLMTVLEDASRSRERRTLELPDPSVFNSEIKPGEFEEEADLTLITSDEKLREIFTPQSTDVQASPLYPGIPGARARTNSAATEKVHENLGSAGLYDESAGENKPEDLASENRGGDLTQADIDAIFQQCRNRATSSASSAPTLSVAFDPRSRGGSNISVSTQGSPPAAGRIRPAPGEVPPAPGGSPTSPRESMTKK